MQAPGNANGGAKRRIVYQAAFESLVRAVHADQDAGLVAELRMQCGYDVRRPQREYPPEVAQQVLDLLTARCFPGWPRDQAHEEFGRRAFAAYRATLVGRVVMAALHLMSVEHALQLASRAAQTVSNYTHFEVIPDGPHALIFRARHSVLTPAYSRGLLDGLLRGSGHPNVVITVDAAHAPEEIDLHLRW